MPTNDDSQPTPAAQSVPADLSHLNPDRIEIGSVAVFAGDWSWSGQPPRIAVGFVGTLIDYWNGWAVFRCTREVVEAIVAEQDRQREQEWNRLRKINPLYRFADLTRTVLRRPWPGHRRVAQYVAARPPRRWYARLWWRLDLTGRLRRRRVDENVSPLYLDGDTLVHDESATYGPESIDRQEPGPDGRYCPMGFVWTWQVVDPADCDRIAGEVPEPGRHREFVMATHQPLRMPHNRLTADAVTYHPGTAGFTAMLRLDDIPVGMIVSSGPGGATRYRPAPSSAMDRQQLDAFVAGCRWRGRPVTEDLVLEALVTEHETDRQIAAAHAVGLTPVILRDSDEHIRSTPFGVALDDVTSRGLREAVHEVMASTIAEHPDLTQFIWQVWTGRGWRFIDIIDLPVDDDPADAR